MLTSLSRPIRGHGLLDFHKDALPIIQRQQLSNFITLHPRAKKPSPF